MSQVDEIRFRQRARDRPQTFWATTPGNGWDILEAASMGAIPVLCAYQVGSCQASWTCRWPTAAPGTSFAAHRAVYSASRTISSAPSTTWMPPAGQPTKPSGKLDSGRDARSSVHLAKAVTSEAYLKVCAGGHEVHAGVGVMREYGLTLHTQRSRTLYHLLGTPATTVAVSPDALGW